MAGEKILCVDDEEPIRKLCTLYLEKRGYRVAVAANGADALKVIEAQGAPDLVITDVNMPVMNGLELVKRLREDARTAGTPIIVLSAMKQEQDVLAGYSHGADDYIGKPIDLAILAAKIDTLFRQTRVAAPMPSARKLGAVVAFLHAKGGVGATTCAVNVAVAMAGDGAKVSLIDLVVPFGNAPMFLDLRPRYTIVDVAKADLSRVTDEDFAQFLTEHQSGIRVLAAPATPDEARIVGAGVIQQAIDLARVERDTLVLDLPARMDESTLTALESADAVCVVTAPHLAAVRATADLLASLAQIGATNERVLVALDRISAKGIDDAGVAKFIKRKVDVVIPYAEKFDVAADMGVPFVSAEPTDRASLALKQLALKLSVHKPVTA